ncbi:uncharacterized protein [Miscanthus floridulus]|uniref:uncharacterized protein n=1 Tax=Miscanthus floridulus TaxID=154761 RepID=UPI00345AC2EE
MDLPQWNGQDTLSIALFIWTESELVRGNTRRKYREYTDGLDVLTQHQVHWCPWDAPEFQNYLSPITRDESEEYRCNVLIFFHVVEIHLSVRVCRQFGRMAGYPPLLYSTNQGLHGFDRRKMYKTKD